jgi:GNAT superfamily N-acetyltransferase
MTDVTIRDATAADGPLLASIERNSPLVMGGRQLAIDRGEDYFAASRLMGEVTILIAAVDGEPAGAFCAALHRTLLGGVERSMFYFHHTRILPRFQDHGVGRKLAAALRERYAGRIDSSYWYISPANEHSLGFARAAQNKWSFGPALIALDTAALAGPAFGRTATAMDATRLVQLFNAAHQGEEMFMPYTTESLSARLARAPRQYSWERVQMTDRAALGVWPEGETTSLRLVEPSGEVSEFRSGAVLDFGYLPGGEDDLVALLRGACAVLARDGMAELTIFSSPGARHWDLLSNLGTPGEFWFWTSELPQPADAESNGLYVDHIYF